MNIKLCASGILTKKGCILLGRRVKDDPSYPGQWCTPGGGVEFGETVEQALKREFVEETGLRIEAAHPLPRIIERINPGSSHTVGFFWKVLLKHPDMAVAGDGFDKLELFSVDNLTDMCRCNLITPLTSLALVEFDIIPVPL